MVKLVRFLLLCIAAFAGAVLGAFAGVGLIYVIRAVLASRTWILGAVACVTLLSVRFAMSAGKSSVRIRGTAWDIFRVTFMALFGVIAGVGAGTAVVMLFMAQPYWESMFLTVTVYAVVIGSVTALMRVLYLSRIEALRWAGHGPRAQRGGKAVAPSFPPHTEAAPPPQAINLLQVAEELCTQHDYAGALAVYEDFESQLREKASASSPNDAACLDGRAECAAGQAQAHMAIGEIDKALEALDREAQFLGELLHQKAEHPRYRHRRALCLYHQAGALMAQGKVGQGILAFEEALSEWESLWRRFPDEGLYRRSLEMGYNNASWLISNQESADNQLYARGLAMAQRVAEITAHADSATLDTLALAYFKAGDVVRAVKTQEMALTLVQRDVGHADHLDDFEMRLAQYKAALEDRTRLHSS